MASLSLFKNGKRSEIGPLDPNSGYVLDVEGHKVLALRVPGKIAREISGQASTIGMLARLKARIMRRETRINGEWLILTNVQNPLLSDYDRFETRVAQELTDVSGIPVSASNLAVSCTSPVAKLEKHVYPAEQVSGGS